MKTVFISFIFMTLLGACAQTSTKKITANMTESSIAIEQHANELIETTQSKQDVINQIMKKSGMDEILVKLPDSVAMGFDQQPKPPMNSRDHNQFRQNLIDAFDGKKMRESIVSYLDDHYESKNFRLFLTMLNKPLVEQMTALEVAAQTPQAMQEMMQAGNLIMGEATQNRLALVRQLDRVMSSTEVAVDMQMMMSSVIAINMNKIVPAGQRMTKNQIKGMLDQMRNQSKYPAQQFIHLNMVYAYRSVSDAELEAYLQEAGSEIGLWSIQLLKGAWLKASENVAIRLSDLMDKTFVKDNIL